MAELQQTTRAHMACRIYLALFDAGEDGLPINVDTAIGPFPPSVENWQAANALLERMDRDGTLDRGREINAVRRYRLPTEMRNRMTFMLGGDRSLVERLQDDLDAVDRGEEIDHRIFVNSESLIRTGYASARPL